MLRWTIRCLDENYVVQLDVVHWFGPLVPLNKCVDVRVLPSLPEGLISLDDEKPTFSWRDVGVGDVSFRAGQERAAREEMSWCEYVNSIVRIDSKRAQRPAVAAGLCGDKDALELFIVVDVSAQSVLEVFFDATDAGFEQSAERWP
uniref:Uncharacterized protein n=1 Tax=Cacopsylla melanoneura TaxID=428564 RepID=A0A8D8ZLX2_9HEMI